VLPAGIVSPQARLGAGSGGPAEAGIHSAVKVNLRVG